MSLKQTENSNRFDLFVLKREKLGIISHREEITYAYVDTSETLNVKHTQIPATFIYVYVVLEIKEILE